MRSPNDVPELRRRREVRPRRRGARRWYAGRTRSRSEKSVHRLLESSGVESYLPLLEQERRWADRRKRVEFPLFPGYLFVHPHRDDLGSVLATPGLVDVVRVRGEPAVVRDDELASIRMLIEGVRTTGELPSPSDFMAVGEAIQVAEGPFAGLVGTLIEERGRTRVAVRLTALRQAVSVDLNRRWVRPLVTGLDRRSD